MEAKFSELIKNSKKCKIGICMENEIPDLLKENLLQLSTSHDLRIYSRKIVFPVTIEASDPSMKLLVDYKNGEIDTFVRGINDDYTFQQKYKDLFHFKQLMRLAILKDAHQNEFCLGPISASEAATFDDRRIFITKTIDFLQSVKINPRVAIMSRCRAGSVDYSKENKINWNESNAIRDELRSKGVDCENVGIELEKAVGHFNVIIPANGMIGNQIFRTLTFLGKGSIIGIPAFSTEDRSFRYCYEDNSRNELDYESHINAASFWASFR